MGGFDLLAPKGLWLLALIPPLVLLYILKVKRTRQRVGSTWLWAAAQRDLLARSPWKKFVLQLPLVVQVLALVALAIAFAKPARRGRELTGSHVAIVIDTSASMGALAAPGGTETRLDVAKKAARELVDALSPGADAMVIEAAREARLACPLDRDKVRLRAAIDRLAVREVEGDLEAAAALAVDRLRQLENGKAYVVTDGALAKPASLEGIAMPLEVLTVGQPVDNAAITRVDVRSGRESGTKREQVQGFVIVANFGKSPREVFVTMREENANDTLASRRMVVQPGERVPVVLTFYPTAGDYRRGLIFEMEPHDALALDDVAYGRVPAGDKLPVFLASAKGAPSPWLERAIAADPMVDLRSATVESLVAGTAPGFDEGSFVVIEGACAATAGAALLLVDPPQGPCLGATVGAMLEHPNITSWEQGDPRLRFLTLDGVHVSKARVVTAESETRSLIRTDQGAIAVDVSTPARIATLLAFDPGESDWPLKASYVLFMRNLLEQARSQRANGVTGPARTGEALRVSVPPGALDLVATGPKGEKIDASVRSSVAIVPDTHVAGLYQVAWKGARGGSVTVAANLASEAESDLGRVLDPAATKGAAVGPAASRVAGHQDMSWALALAALALLVFDVWWFTRPVRPTGGRSAPKPVMPERGARAKITPPAGEKKAA